MVRMSVSCRWSPLALGKRMLIRSYRALETCCGIPVWHLAAKDVVTIQGSMSSSKTLLAGVIRPCFESEQMKTTEQSMNCFDIENDNVSRTVEPPTTPQGCQQGKAQVRKGSILPNLLPGLHPNAGA